MASFGEEIRRERELRGISLREISDATKINLRFLEALEKDDFEHLPGGQFNKGFIRAYANYIGVDAEKMVNSYLLELSKQEEAKKPITPIVPARAEKKGKNWQLMAALIAIAVSVAVIIIFLVIFFMSRSAKENQVEGPQTMKEIVEKSNKKAEQETVGEIAEAKPLSQALQENQPITLMVEVKRRASIRAECDGRELINKTLSRGEKRTLICDNELLLSLSDREAFQISLNGQPLHLPGDLGKNLENLKITKDNLEVLIHGNQKRQ